MAKNFNYNKERINNKLMELEQDSKLNHTDTLKDGAVQVEKMLTSQKVDDIIAKADFEPDFFTIFGATEDDINDWRLLTEDRIYALQWKAAMEIHARKASVQSGFQKLKYPTFHGDILSYQEFKQRWEDEVTPERRPEPIELAALREALGATIQNKITEVKTLAKAWKILDIHFGDQEEVWAKLKEKILNIKLKSTDSNQRMVELFDSVQYISAKIKAAKGISLLEVDQEYITLIKRHLPQYKRDRWIESGRKGWNNFYTFLEEMAMVARKNLTDDTIIAALSGDKKEEKRKCNFCGKNHSGKCMNPKAAASVAGGQQERNCPVCQKPIYKTKNPDGSKRPTY